MYAATHKNNGSRVAIKVLHPEFSRDADTRSRFLQEGYAANQVGHAGVVRILDDDVTEDGNAFLVMELLEGEILEQRRVRKGGRLGLAEVIEIADQLLDVISAAHAKKIVHRDIKPENLFVTKAGRLKVLDFGFAQMRSGFRTEQTETGFLLGTPGFMSPEQAVGKRGEVDAQTDVWAIGATMFTLLSSEPVHLTESAAEALFAAANRPPRSLGEAMPNLPPRVIEIVDRATAFAKTDRWPSTRAMQQALRAVSGASATPKPPPPRAGAIELTSDRTMEEQEIELPELPSSGLESDRTVMAAPDIGSGLAVVAPEVRAPGYRQESYRQEKVPQSLKNTHLMSPPPPSRRPREEPMPHTPPMPAMPRRSVTNEPQLADLIPSDIPPSSNNEHTLVMAGTNVAPPPVVPPPNTRPLPMPAPVPADDAPFAPTLEVYPKELLGQNPPEAPKSKVLPFIAVVLVSMVVVVVTGLLVLGAAE